MKAIGTNSNSISTYNVYRSHSYSRSKRDEDRTTLNQMQLVKIAAQNTVLVSFAVGAAIISCILTGLTILTNSMNMQETENNSNHLWHWYLKSFTISWYMIEITINLVCLAFAWKFAVSYYEKYCHCCDELLQQRYMNKIFV